MNYILVNKSDVGDKYPYATSVGEKIILPSNFRKVLGGIECELITDADAKALLNNNKEEDNDE